MFMFTMTDLDSNEHGFILGIKDNNNERLLGSIECKFYNGVSTNNSDIDDKVVAQREYLTECMGYTPNIISATLQDNIHLVDLEEIFNKLISRIYSAVLVYFRMDIPDLYICMNLTDEQVEFVKSRGFSEAVGFDLHANKNLLILNKDNGVMI